MTIPESIQKMKTRLGVASNVDLVMILLVFSLAGSSVVFVRKPVFYFMGIQPETPMWIKILVYIPLIVPVYQLNLLVWGFLLGQFPFFWKKEKALGRFLARNIRSLFSADKTS